MWAGLIAFAISAVVVAGVGVAINRPPDISPDAQRLLGELALIPALAARPDPPDYDRSAFGAAWTDDTDAGGSGNGCDTRNDILDRDLRDKTFAAVDSCARAVATGEFRSPYSGAWITFRRGQGTGAKVQIDHIVPLSFAWDMGARLWNPAVRQRFANDPANLVAVDGDANQDKSDKQPSQWMPANKGFHCQYAAQFVVVMRTYGLYLDAPSVPVLRSALRRC
ncbi:HNH endonuclease family protein [Nocardia sp. 348MFTsu5.1]|uniref:HNH endonuclease family protein n=1 Tax=Nocardia sp. 348MFTsu5.1 TaxID=1172185 RepID=UPI000382A29C|nr:HNH endonuclease family protein [Nocardia sp. 348MFTsu5.1]